jgi:hypothetical protein
LIKASQKTRKYLAVNLLSVSKPPRAWNYEEWKNDYESKQKLEREYMKLLGKYWGW